MPGLGQSLNKEEIILDHQPAIVTFCPLLATYVICPYCATLLIHATPVWSSIHSNSGNSQNRIYAEKGKRKQKVQYQGDYCRIQTPPLIVSFQLEPSKHGVFHDRWSDYAASPPKTQPRRKAKFQKEELLAGVRSRWCQSENSIPMRNHFTSLLTGPGFPGDEQQRQCLIPGYLYHKRVTLEKEQWKLPAI